MMRKLQAIKSKICQLRILPTFKQKKVGIQRHTSYREKQRKERGKSWLQFLLFKSSNISADTAITHQGTEQKFLLMFLDVEKNILFCSLTIAVSAESSDDLNNKQCSQGSLFSLFHYLHLFNFQLITYNNLKIKSTQKIWP